MTSIAPGIVLAVLLAAGVAVAAWLVLAPLWTGQADPMKTRRGRLQTVGLSAAVVVIALLAASSARSWWVVAVVLVVVVPVLIALRSRVVAWMVSAAFLVLGLDGFVVARTSAGPLVPVTSAFFVLPAAYALLVLGGWLAWRSIYNRPDAARRALGKLAETMRTGQRWGVLLILVVIMTAALITPNVWVGPGPIGAGSTIILLAGAALIVRRAPAVAAGAAAIGFLVLGLAGVFVAVSWSSGSWPFPVTPADSVLFGAVAVSGGLTSYLAVAQAVVLIGIGCWLVPQTIPAARRLLGMAPDAELLGRVQQLTESRDVAVDSSAADLRRLERDLHDGAQARLVALGMSLRAAERLIPSSPDAALALVAEARESSARALTELRELVRGVHPPVLADRGLADAVRALALDCPLHVETEIDLPGRLPAPVETACYFAVAEVLTNAAKHSGARQARVAISHAAGMLRIEVTDFGLGGADPAQGSGLAGVEKRLATFDGILAVSSPTGGPTIIVMELPCALSSPKTSSC